MNTFSSVSAKDESKKVTELEATTNPKFISVTHELFCPKKKQKQKKTFL